MPTYAMVYRCPDPNCGWATTSYSECDRHENECGAGHEMVGQVEDTASLSWRERGDEFITVQEFADAFRVSKMTVYRMIQDGTIESIKVGRSFRIPVAEVNKIRKG